MTNGKRVKLHDRKDSWQLIVRKLRIILLFEADFNANNKWQKCFKQKKKTSWQMNSLAVTNLNWQCLNKDLFYNLVRFQWQPMALSLNDAKSCYNCITLLAATLCLCHLGRSQPMVQSMITTLHEMEYHIHTTYGDSKVLASQMTWQALIAGIGQGNGVGPHIWAVGSSPMFQIMWSDGFYANIVAAIPEGKDTGWVCLCQKHQPVHPWPSYHQQQCPIGDAKFG